MKQFSKRHIRESPPRTTYPTPKQVDRLVPCASPTAGRVIRLLAETRMRLEEVGSLEWSQVSIQRREVRLTKTKTSSPGVVPLSDTAIGTLRHITSPYVFWHDAGDRYSCFAGRFTQITRRAKVPFRCHDLKHHFASLFAQRTGDLPALQAILGHKTTGITIRYSYLMTEHLHHAMNENRASAATRLGTAASDLKR